MTLRSSPVIWRIGSTPSSMSSAEQATGESLTVAAWLSVTLTASTEPTSARAPARTSSGSGSRGGPSSAVTTKLRDDSAEASIARLSGELVVVVVAARASVGIAVAGAQDRDVRAFAGSTIRRVLADVGGEQVLGETSPMVERRRRSRDARSAGL